MLLYWFCGCVDGFKRKGWPKLMSKHSLFFHARIRGRFSTGWSRFGVGEAAWELLTFLPVRCEQSLGYKVKLGAVGFKQAQLPLILLQSPRDPELPRAQFSPGPPGGSISPPVLTAGTDRTRGFPGHSRDSNIINVVLSLLLLRSLVLQTAAGCPSLLFSEQILLFRRN